MEKLTGIPDNELDLVLGDLEREGLSVYSRVRLADGSWMLEFGSEVDPKPELAAPGSRAKFVSARASEPRKVLYLDASGNGEIRSGGSRAWRNNNPGNIRKGSFTQSHGAIGDDGAFAIFADEAIGRAALLALLGTSGYSTRTLSDAIARYAPAHENDTMAYVANVEHATGISRGTVLSTLDDAAMSALAAAIQKIEGWKEGVVEIETKL